MPGRCRFPRRAGGVELNPSRKLLIPMTGNGRNMRAWNMGAGLSKELTRWAIRPEIGFLISPGDEGIFVSYGLGFTVNPRK